MDRQQLQQSIRPFSFQDRSKANLPDTPVGAAVGFTNLTAIETGEIHGEATPSDPEKGPKARHDQKEMLRKAFALQKASLDDLAPYRVRTMWRFLRYLACRLGVLPPNRLIGEMPEEAGDPINGFDPWLRPLTPQMLTPPHPDRTTRELMSLVHKATEIGEPVPYQHLHPTQDRITTSERTGFTLLPTKQTAPYWTQAFRVVASQLFLQRGSVKDKDQGRLGMVGLDDPDLCVIACPTIPEVLMWEMFLVDEAMKMLAGYGEHLIDTSLRDHYGLLPFETEAIISQARRAITDRTSIDLEEQRALMVTRIHDVMSRAKDALDPRAELAALKLLSQTVGLTRSEPEDLKSMFRKVVNEASKERRQLEYQPEDA